MTNGSPLRPLMENIDYPDYIDFVNTRAKSMSLDINAQKSKYLAEDIEGYLLESRREIAGLTETELYTIDEMIRERA